MNIDNPSPRDEDDVGRTWQITTMETIPIAKRMNEPAHKHLRFRVLSTNAAHVQSSLLSRENVYHA